MSDLVEAKNSSTSSPLSNQSLCLDYPDSAHASISEESQPFDGDIQGTDQNENEYANIDHDDGVKYCQLDSDIDISIVNDVEGDEKMLSHIASSDEVSQLS